GAREARSRLRRFRAAAVALSRGGDHRRHGHPQRRHQGYDRGDRNRGRAHGEGRPNSGRARQGQDLPERLVRAWSRYLDQDLEPAREHATRRSRHRLHRQTVSFDRRSHARRYQAHGETPARAGHAGHGRGPAAGRHLEDAMIGAMRLKHSIDLALTDRVGPNGAAPAALADALKRTVPALAWLRARHADGSLPLLRLPAKHDDLVSIKDAARRLTATGATDIVFLGTGGSSLGGQTLAQLEDHAVPGAGLLRSGPRLHFMDNLDPGTYAALLERLPLATTHFVAISKSGGTGETLMQTAAALAAMKAAGLAVRIPDLFLGITEPAKGGKRSGLRV